MRVGRFSGPSFTIDEVFASVVSSKALSNFHSLLSPLWLFESLCILVFKYRTVTLPGCHCVEVFLGA